MNTTHCFLYLAPIRGITDYLFRSTYHKHFPYFDEAVAPFINPQKYLNLKDKYLSDILPENNKNLPVVPQLLYNTSEDFIHVAKRLQEMGYNHINWNLGCPAPQVAKKRRGSGLLCSPETILGILDAVCCKLSASISIKARIGYDKPDQFISLLPRLHDYPLREIILHPRLGKQLYRGSVDLESFEACYKSCRMPLVYNGDLTTHDDVIRILSRFSAVNKLMIGRGAIADPFLAAEIKGETFSSETKKDMLVSFHHDIFGGLQERLSGPGHLLNKMKEIWNYFGNSFPDKKKEIKKMQKAATLDKYHEAASLVFEL